MKNTVSRLQDCLSRNLNKAISIALSLALLLNITAEGFAQLLPSGSQNDFSAWQKQFAYQYNIDGIINGAYNRSKDAPVITALKSLIEAEYQGVALTEEELEAELEFAYQAYLNLENLRQQAYLEGKKVYSAGKAPDATYNIEKYFINICQDKEEFTYNSQTYECPAFMQGILSGILNDIHYKEEINNARLEKGQNAKSNNSVFSKVRDIALNSGVDQRDYPRFAAYLEGIISKTPDYCDNDIFLVDYMPGIEYGINGKSRGLKEKSRQSKEKRQLDCVNSGEAMVLLALLDTDKQKTSTLIYSAAQESWNYDYGPIALESAITALSVINTKASWQKIESLLISETLKKKGFTGQAKALLDALSVEHAAKVGIGIFSRYIRGGGGNYLNGYSDKTQYIISEGSDEYSTIYGNVLEDIGRQIADNDSNYAKALTVKILDKYVKEEAISYSAAKVLTATGNVTGMILKRDTGDKVHTPLVTGVLQGKSATGEKAAQARKLINNLDWWDINADTQARVNNAVYIKDVNGLTLKGINSAKQTRFKDNDIIKSAGYWTDMGLMVVLAPALIRSIPSIIRGGANLAKTSYRLSRIKIAGKGRLLKAVKGRGAGVNIAAIKAENTQLRKLYEARKSAITKLRAKQTAGKRISTYQSAKANNATAAYKLAKSEHDILKAERALTPEGKTAIEAEINAADKTNASLQQKYLSAHNAYNGKVSAYNAKVSEYNQLLKQGDNIRAAEVLEEAKALKAQLGNTPKAPQAVKLTAEAEGYLSRYRSYQANLGKYEASASKLKTAREGALKEWFDNSSFGRWWNKPAKGDGLIFNHSGKTETTLAEAFNIKGEYTAPTGSGKAGIAPANRAENVYNWLGKHKLGFAANTLRLVNNKATLLGTTLLFNYNVATVTPGMLNSGKLLAATEQVSTAAAKTTNAAKVFSLSVNDIARSTTGLGLNKIKPVDIVDPRIFKTYNSVPLIHGNILQGRGASYWLSQLNSSAKIALAGATVPAMLIKDVYKYADGRLLNLPSANTAAVRAPAINFAAYSAPSAISPSSYVYEVPGIPHTLKHSAGATVEDILSVDLQSSSTGKASLLNRINSYLGSNSRPAKPSTFIYSFLTATTIAAMAPMISSVYHLSDAWTNSLVSVISYGPALTVPFMGYFFKKFKVSVVGKSSAIANLAGVGLTVLGGLNGFTNDGSVVGLVTSLAGITLISLSNEIKYAAIFPLIDSNFSRKEAFSLMTKTTMARSLGTVAFLEFGPLLDTASNWLGFGGVNSAVTFPLMLLPLSAAAFLNMYRTNFKEVPISQEEGANGVKELVRLFKNDWQVRNAALSFMLMEAAELTTSLLLFSMAKEHYGALSDMPNILGGVLIYATMGGARYISSKLQDKGLLTPAKTYKVSAALIFSGLGAFALGGISPLGLVGAGMYFVGGSNLFSPLLSVTTKGRSDKSSNITLLVFTFSSAAAAGGWLLSLVSELSGSLQFSVLVPIGLIGTAFGLSKFVFKDKTEEELVPEERESFDFAESLVYASGDKDEKVKTKKNSKKGTGKGKPEVENKKK